MAEDFTTWWKKLARDGFPPHSPLAYLFALICVAVAALVRYAFGFFGSQLVPFAAFFPAVLLSAFAGGIGAGLFSVLLSLAATWWLFPIAREGLTLNIILFLLSTGAIIAITELYRATSRRLHNEEKKRKLLVRELEHRGKNTFAIVQSIVSQTLHNQRDLADNIVGRIRSVSATNDIITKSEHQTASLKTILQRELEPYGCSRAMLHGYDIELEAELARSVALIVHELVTNAVKYGALSQPEGRLKVDWTHDGTRVCMLWDESNGPPLTKPFEPGFGAKLITRLLKSHQGEAVPDFRIQGLGVRISFELPQKNSAQDLA